jgi:hypothetical protein
MTLPTSRNDTLTPASTVPASLLNALQDQVVGAKRPPLWRWQTPQGLVAADVNLGYVADGSIIAGGAGAVLGLVPVTGLLDGDRDDHDRDAAGVVEHVHADRLDRGRRAGEGLLPPG